LYLLTISNETGLLNDLIENLDPLFGISNAFLIYFINSTVASISSKYNFSVFRNVKASGTLLLLSLSG